jgi:hypothetical protein
VPGPPAPPGLRLTGTDSLTIPASMAVPVSPGPSPRGPADGNDMTVQSLLLQPQRPYAHAVPLAADVDGQGGVADRGCA